jgi:hypothetical protein
MVSGLSSSLAGGDKAACWRKSTSDFWIFGLLERKTKMIATTWWFSNILKIKQSNNLKI